MKNYLLLSIVFLVFFISSCEDSKNESGNYSDGIFVVNEGQFNAGNGSITFYDDDEDSTALNIFQVVNNRPLGDVVQSISFHDNKGFIVVNNSNKVEVVEAGTFEEIATITGFELPRYFLGINDNKAYVSQWGADGVSGSIKVIDLNSNTISSTITISGNGPDKMKMIGGKVYVGHSGGFGFDQAFTIIDPDTDEVLQSISANYNPGDIVEDYNGNLWVLSLGYSDWTTGDSYPARLTAYDSEDFSIIKDFDLVSNYPSDLVIDETERKLFFILNGEIVEQSVDSDVLNLTTVANDSYFYGLGYDEENKRLYAGDAGDFVSQGIVKMYDENGNTLGEFNTGVAPGDFFTE